MLFFKKTQEKSNSSQVLPLTDCSAASKVESRKIKCIVDGRTSLQCLKEKDDIYLPFKFIKKQFDVSGKLKQDDIFEYFTSYSKVMVPESNTYNVFGPFGHFATYNVETRDRVRCINAQYGVPMSTQWDTTPYFYPIQIAQFALQHYSRNRTEEEPKIHIVDILSSNTKLSQETRQKKFRKDGFLNAKFDGDLENNVQVAIPLNNQRDLSVLLFSWKPLSTDTWFSLQLLNVSTSKHITLNYKHTDDDRCLWQDDEPEDYLQQQKKDSQKQLVFTSSLGQFSNTSGFQNVVLDSVVETSKAFSLLSCSTKDHCSVVLKTGDVMFVSLTFHGPLEIRLPVKQQSTAHYDQFLNSCDWFLKSQNAEGGWAVPVERTIADDRLVLKAGWHSAMAQGHAISVLVRGYHLTRRTEFVDSVQKALKLFTKQASEGGVLNELFGYPWYEEYPTTPGTFVLNGFLYSLIGLHDASAIEQLKTEAESLFFKGVESLKLFLPLYDTGAGSVYDLRHLGLKTAPNLARWDYHAVHIYLLKWLFNITGDKFFNDVADRWAGYAHGKRAKHN
uniref:Heparosan-N-sulfate-glucuronate 5-epimerase n=1 Tax=Ditylenchus dipsaci TaxID=166011 RepID=A0A915DPX6_9BILA